MAVNKNFVVKNGLEVNTNLILANASTNKVGIGSTAPRFELDVAGGIGATDSYVSGVSTIFTELNVGTDGSVLTVLGIGGSVGVGTATPEYLLDIRSPVSTGQTALYVQGDVEISGDLIVDDISFDQADINSLNVIGIATISHLDLTNAIISGVSTFNNYVDFSNDLNISGITTITNTTDSTTFNNGALVIEGGLGIEKSVNIGGDLDVLGNISIAGSFFSVSSQEVIISNKDIVLGFTTEVSPNDDTADHGGIAIASTEGSPLVSFTASGINTLPDTYKQLMWFRSGTLGFSTDTFAFNYGLAIGTTTMSDGVRLAVGSDIAITDTTINTININSSSIDSSNINISGISTLGSIVVNSGIITASTGIVTYYGDGSKLTNILSGVGISSLGTFIGAGATILNFVGTAVSTVAVSSGIATINLLAGAGGGTPGGSDGQVQYNNAGGFAGSPNFTFDGSNVNISGILTASSFVGGGSSLTSLNASQLTLGTISGDRGVTAGSATASFVEYNGTTKTAGQFDGGSTDPTNTIRLNYDGYFYATRFYGDGSNLNALNASNLSSGTISGDRGVTSGSLNSSFVEYNGTTRTAGQFYGASTDPISTTRLNYDGYLHATAFYGDIAIFGSTVDINSSRINAYGSAINISSSGINVVGVVTATDFNSSSDQTLKTNIQTIENSLNITDQLRGVSFNWKENGTKSYGVIAQELEEVLPELVKNGEVKSVNYNGLIGVLIEAIKDLKKEIEELKSYK